MQAIETKYLSPTNAQSSRIKATCEGGSITLSWEHGLDAFENHKRVAEALLKKLNWNGLELIGGGLKNSYVFVLVKKPKPCLVEAAKEALAFFSSHNIRPNSEEKDPRKSLKAALESVGA